MKFVYCFFLFLFVLQAWTGLEAKENYDYYLNQAKQAYLDQDFDKAISFYDKGLDSVSNRAVVFYNLGNCYYQKADYGRAMLFYARAARLMPRDADLRHNMALIRDHHMPKYKAPEAGSLWMDLNRFLNRLSVVEYSWLFVLAYVVLFVYGFLLLRCRFKGRSLRPVRTEFVLFFSLFFLVVSLKMYDIHVHKYGVVTSSTVSVKSGPAEHFDQLFEAYGAQAFRVKRKVNGWYNIKFDDGLEGWLKKDNVDLI